MKTLLITGAAGSIGGHLRRELAGRYALRLSDLKPIKLLAPGESFVKGDVAKLSDMLRITKGVDAILHLGAWSVEGDWPTILSANIEGTYNAFEAARRNGVKRILFPSSNHAVGYYRRDQTIDHLVYPKPDSRYGVSKVFGEALGSLYADKYGLEVFIIRIGNVAPLPADKRRLSIWISPRDLAQLVSIGVDHPDVRFEVVYGISGNRRAWYDNANATRLGYHPVDDSEPYATEILAKHVEHAEPDVERYQGGTFVVAELGGDPSRNLPKAAASSRKSKAGAKAKPRAHTKVTKSSKKAKVAKKPKRGKK
ncbi:MAG: UDP-glucose 4-epimerase [Proteobacteria bacterium]|nr:MAG: UDP-glucose 4-epimerase [Pseudomonadota bacterium]